MFAKKKYLFFLFILFFFLFAPSVLAISISPLRYNLSLAPEGEKRVFIIVKNNDKKRKEFNLNILSVQQNENGTLFFGSNLDQAEKWIEISTSSFYLQPILHL